MPRIRRHDKRRQGPLNTDDLQLQCEPADALERRYGALTAAQERYEELLERGDLMGERWECAAFWKLNAPPELHDEPWVEYRIFDTHPEIMAEQEQELEEFQARRAAWLEENDQQQRSAPPS